LPAPVFNINKVKPVEEEEKKIEMVEEPKKKNIFRRFLSIFKKSDED